MRSRVDRVALKLRVPETDRARVSAIRAAVEGVVLQEALDELERAIHDRLGHEAIVRVRRLSVRWQLDAAAVADVAHARELGRDLARALLDDIDALSRPHRLRPPDAANVVVFEDADHLVAAVLADRSEGIAAWFHAPIDPAIVWAELAQDPVRTAAVERWLERMDHRLADLRRAVADAPSMMKGERGEVPRLPARSGDAAVAVGSPISHGDAIATGAIGSSATPPLVARNDHDARDTIASPMPELVVTDHAGAWYLVRLVAELGLAEALWAAGAREGEVVAHIVRAVLGRDGARDPVAQWIGGAFERMPELEPLADWAIDELLATLPRSPAALVASCACLTASAGLRMTELVATAAAAIVARFCARLDLGPDVARLRAHLAIPGHMQLVDDRVIVTLPMDHIDIDVRRAGLDFDPGYVPWLARKVELVFDA